MAALRTSPGKARSALLAQWEALVPWLEQMPGDAWTRPAAVTGWTVADLVAHLTLVWNSVSTALAAPTRERPQSLAAFVATYPAAAAGIAARTRQAAAGSPSEIQARLRTSAGRATRELTALADDADPVVAARRGPVRVSDFLVTRCIELVVHADDLARSVPALGAAPIDRTALQLAVRALAAALAERAPGRSVEVRVPPFAAVQCVAGPRHTRGTPPAVVESDPLTFLRAVTGRINWQEAVASGAIRSSGLRTDLSPYLPLLS